MGRLREACGSLADAQAAYARAAEIALAAQMADTALLLNAQLVRYAVRAHDAAAALEHLGRATAALGATTVRKWVSAKNKD